MTELEIPKRLVKQPRWRGFPVPYVALARPDGSSDFRVVDEEKRIAVMIERKCQLCGERLGKFIFFTAGVRASFVGQFWEPPMHLECLVYAMQTCPFIVGKMDHGDIAEIQRKHPNVPIGADSSAHNHREPFWVITKASNYRLTRFPTVLAVVDNPLFQHPYIEPPLSRERWEQIADCLRAGTIQAP